MTCVGGSQCLQTKISICSFWHQEAIPSMRQVDPIVVCTHLHQKNHLSSKGRGWTFEGSSGGLDSASAKNHWKLYGYDHCIALRLSTQIFTREWGEAKRTFSSYDNWWGENNTSFSLKWTNLIWYYCNCTKLILWHSLTVPFARYGHIDIQET